MSRPYAMFVASKCLDNLRLEPKSNRPNFNAVNFHVGLIDRILPLSCQVGNILYKFPKSQNSQQVNKRVRIWPIRIFRLESCKRILFWVSL